MVALDDVDALRGGARRHDLELVVQRKLVLQRLAKVLVVVDDEGSVVRCSCGMLP